MTQLFGQIREGEDVVVRRIERRVARYIEQLNAQGRVVNPREVRADPTECQFADDAPTQVLRARSEPAPTPQAAPGKPADESPLADEDSEDGNGLHQPSGQPQTNEPSPSSNEPVLPAATAKILPPPPPVLGRKTQQRNEAHQEVHRPRPPAQLSGLQHAAPPMSAPVFAAPPKPTALRLKPAAEAPKSDARFAEARKAPIGALVGDWPKGPAQSAQPLEDAFGSSFGLADDDRTEVAAVDAERPFGIRSRVGDALPSASSSDWPRQMQLDDPQPSHPPRVRTVSPLLIITFVVGVLVIIYFFITSERYIY